MNRTLYFYLIIIIFSCNSKKDTESKFLQEINTILINELAINKEVKTIYVIQDNSCTICYENIITMVDSYDNSDSLGVIYLSKFKNVSQESTSFLNFRYLNQNRIYVSNSTRLRELLLKSVGGFSKGFYSIIVTKKGLNISALN